jgi:hypothetical protein
MAYEPADDDLKPSITKVNTFSDSSNKTQLSAGLKTCDIQFISKLRCASPSLWICPFCCRKAAFSGHPV